MATKSAVGAINTSTAEFDRAEKKKKHGASILETHQFKGSEKLWRKANQTTPQLDDPKKEIWDLALPSSEIPLLSYALKRFAKDGKIADPKIKSGESIEDYLKANPLTPRRNTAF